MRHRARGFTLLEIVIALTMISMILTLAYGSFSASTRIVQQREAYARSLHRADFVLRHMTDQLQSIYLDQAAFYRMEDPLDLFDGASDRLTFWTEAPVQTRRATYRGGLQRLMYSVRPADEDEEGAAFTLQFAAMPELRPADADPAAHWSIPVDTVEFEYHDGAGWTGSWNIEETQRLPHGIRVTIGMPNGRGDTLELATVIPLAVRAATAFSPDDVPGAGGGAGGAGDTDAFPEEAAADEATGADSTAGGSNEPFNPFGGSGGQSRRRDPIRESQ